ncbi:hypothetical protein KPP03845_200268 (plasmid) [Streptomyces xanthophaeus]|uniref:hypothetical protein n=1 Tax=Streptomyces xanthophaeus TaxID=67385 RepID=UPI00233F0F14|nr:hypothetical protein [Streptomyces xanthophaeus]WCD91307.1 hypothetical protein KPP03845_200268 [Streptomyces xanthophaeus]
MNNTARALAALALAGAALSFAGAAHADKVLNNMNEVVEWDRSVNNYGVTYGDSVNAGQGNIINPQTLISGISGIAPLAPSVDAPTGPIN